VLETRSVSSATRASATSLIWPNDPGSPLGPLYGNETKDGVFHGYRFTHPEAQGPDAARRRARPSSSRAA